MTDERLSSIEKKIDDIQRAISIMAVQAEKISQMQLQLNSLWKKYDDLCGPEGTVQDIRQFQAGCPRTQVKFLWAANISFCILMLGIGVKLLTG